MQSIGLSLMLRASKLMIFISKKAKIVIGYYLLIVAYWLFAYLSHIKTSEVNYLYQFFFGLIPLVGGIGGLINAKKWGLLKSRLGKALFFLSLGLITWGLGQMVWAYYVIFGITDVPYPSFADLGYVISWPLWALGMINLAKSTGAKYGFRNKFNKILAFVIPVVVAITSYYLLIVIAKDGTLIPQHESLLKIVLDIAYPLGDIVILTFSLVVFGLTFKFLGGVYRLPILALLAGFVVNYVADFSFSYTTTAGSYYNGHWVDLLFPTAMALLAFGVNSIDPKSRKSNPESTSKKKAA